jgi:hypothetical protein
VRSTAGRSFALAASGAWGALLAFVLFGAVLIRSVALLVYLACAFGAWLWSFIAAVRDRPEHGIASALRAIPLSLLGPVAIAPLLGARAGRRPAPSMSQTESVEVEAVRPPPQLAPPVVAEIRPEDASRPPESHASPIASALLLTALLIGSLVAFVAGALVFLLWAVLAGIHLITYGVALFIDVGAGVAATGALVATALIWHKRTRTSSRRFRFGGWAAIAGVGVIIATGIVLIALLQSPQNLKRPSISGRPRFDSRLTANPGGWNAPNRRLSFDYQWQVCGSSCIDITDATASHYVPRRRDVGTRIRVCVIATNNGGALDILSSACAYSAETPPIDNVP